MNKFFAKRNICTKSITISTSMKNASMRMLLLLLMANFIPFTSICQLINNYDTCRTHVYYQYIGSTAKETHIEKARTVQDNGIISAGYSKQGTGQNAIIIKQNTNGQVVWQREYGNAAYDEQFTDWRELPNKQLVLVGIAKNRTTLQSVFFMMLLAADGNLIWQKSYSDIAVLSNISNVKVYPDFYGEYFFAVETASAIVYGMANSSGINWQRSINISTGTKLVAVISHYKRLLIATNTVETGFRVANYYYIGHNWTGNPQTISSTIKLGGANQNSHYILHDYEQFGQYSYFSGIRSLNNAPYELIRININQASIRESLETIATPGVALDSLSRSAISIYGDGISFTAGKKNNRLNAVKVTGSEIYPSNLIWSASYQLPDSIALKGNIKTWDNSYVFFGQKQLASGNQQIIQLKTDSASLGPTCISRRQENFSLAKVTFPAETVQYTYNSLHTLTASSYAASLSNGTIDTLTLCKELKCPTLPLSDSCVDSYQKLYKAYENSGFSNIQVVNGRIFVSGRVSPMDYIPEQISPFIAEMNRNGQVVHQKKFVIGIGSTARMYKGIDSSLLLYGFTSDSAYYPSFALAKIDTNLNLKWIKTLRLTSTIQYAGDQSAGEVKQANDGSHFILYSNATFFPGPRTTMLYLTKLDANGNFLWSKVYRASYGGTSIANYIMGFKLEIAGGNVYIMCRNAYNAYSSSILLKVSESNGNLLWCKKYSSPSEHIDLTSLIYMYNNELFLGGKFNDGVKDNQTIIVKTNSDGSILSSASYKNPSSTYDPDIDVMYPNNGKIYMSGRVYSTPPIYNTQQYSVTVNNNLDIVNAKKRLTTLDNRASALMMGRNGQLYETGSYETSYNFWQPYLIKFSNDGNVGTCSSDTMVLQKVSTPTISVTDITCIQSDTVFTMRTPVYRTEQFFLATSNLICVSVPGCNYFDITGNENICDKSKPYTYRAIRNSGCAAPLQWLYDNTKVQVLGQTDSSITMRFIANGSMYLKTEFASNCNQYKDSLLINISSSTPPILNLGVDTTLCPGATVLIKAKKGFMSYVWQDGSTDSTFLATMAGLYYVTVTDSCNNIQSDSIRIQANGNGPILNLGPDSNFCSSNAILLNARRGFLSYQWQDGSTDSVFTATSQGLYHVKVTDVCGNTFRDTVKISSYRKATSLNLGADAILCNGGSRQLNAGRGFKDYRWQDGSIDSIFMANSTGLYHVQVTDSCGNQFRDSINLLTDNATVFDIGRPDTTICKKDSVLLQVTAGFSNYAWSPIVNIQQQGLSAIVFPNVPTRYYVSAIKQNGCLAIDSILVNVHTPPSIYLGADTSICKGDTILLSAGPGLQNYVWSTGEQTPTINAYQVGLYHVAAKDNRNCSTKDTLSITSIMPLPSIQLPADASICSGDTIQLYPGNFSRYHWYNGSLQPKQPVYLPGKYWVTVTDNNGCSNSDTFNLVSLKPKPVNFLPDTLHVCMGETYSLNGFSTYSWNTGNNTATIALSGLQAYWVKVSDNSTCKGSDTVHVVYSGSEKITKVTAFSPNKDGVNDIFWPIESNCITSFRMEIFNRWGQQVYYTSNPAKGWDGTYNQMPVPTAVYYYIVHYKNLQGQAKTLSGSITLLR